MNPFMFGGDMVDSVSFERTTFAPLPLKFEAGTANFIGAIALGEAIAFLQQFDSADIASHERDLTEYCTEQLSAIEGLRIYGTTEGKCPIVSFNLEGAHPYDVGMILDKLGIAIRTGHHCAEPVMAHYGVSGMCRASFAMYNTREEIDALVAGVERAARMLR
jgi:cysteine desulfurase/selenocysteine lyase